MAAGVLGWPASGGKAENSELYEKVPPILSPGPAPASAIWVLGWGLRLRKEGGMRPF